MTALFIRKRSHVVRVRVLTRAQGIVWLERIGPGNPRAWWTTESAFVRGYEAACPRCGDPVDGPACCIGEKAAS